MTTFVRMWIDGRILYEGLFVPTPVESAEIFPARNSLGSMTPPFILFKSLSAEWKPLIPGWGQHRGRKSGKTFRESASGMPREDGKAFDPL